MTYIILFAVAAGIGWLIYRKSKAGGTKKPSAAKRKGSQQFAGVELIAGKNPCSAARELSGKKLLAAEAMPLPLKNCTQVTCNCGYRKLDDRRQDEDGRRSSDIGIKQIMYAGRESRTNPDRRGYF